MIPAKGYTRSDINTRSQSALISKRLFSISGSNTVADGQALAMNLNVYAQTRIESISVNGDHYIRVYPENSTGTADGIFAASNMNQLSSDECPSTAQIFTNSSNSGSVLASGYKSISPSIMVGADNNLSISALNETGASKSIEMTIVFEEIGDRSDSVGLTPSEEITANTEMSNYG